jgi:hypothetical protein
MRHNIICIVLLLSCVSPMLNAQTTRWKEAQVICPVELAQLPMTPYGFALATLNSLGSARDAVIDVDTGFATAQKAGGNQLTFITTVMQGVKLSTNDYICAKRAVQPFTNIAALGSLTPDQRRHIAKAANVLIAIYDKRISLNERSLPIIKKISINPNRVDVSDPISTMQVESGELWNDLVPTVYMSVLLLIDMRATDANGNFITTSDPNAGYQKRLVITKAEKQALVDWIDQRFTEFKNGTSEDKISEPAKDARLYLDLFSKGHMCSDEPATTAAGN